MAEIKVVWNDRFDFFDEGGERADFGTVDEAIAYCQGKIDKYFKGQPDATILTLSNKKKKNKSAIKSAMWESYKGFSTSWQVVVDGKIHWTDEYYASSKCDDVMAQFSNRTKSART